MLSVSQNGLEELATHNALAVNRINLDIYFNSLQVILSFLSVCRLCVYIITRNLRFVFPFPYQYLGKFSIDYCPWVLCLCTCLRVRPCMCEWIEYACRFLGTVFVLLLFFVCIGDWVFF